MGKKLKDAGYDAVLQLLPFNSLGRQTAEWIDTKNRTTVDDTDIAAKLMNKALKSYPGFRQMLPERITTSGEVQDSRNFYDTFLNPSITGKANLSNAKKELIRLYKEDKETIQFPRIASKKVTPTRQGLTTYESVKLTGRQRMELQKAMGEATMEAVEKLTQKDAYKKADDSKRAEAIQQIINRKKKEAERQIINKYNLKKKKER